jgi:hypothetical protein
LQIVSEEFSNQMNAKERKTYAKIEWRQIDVDANVDCSLVCANTHQLSNLNSVIDKENSLYCRIATMERIKMDGTFVLPTTGVINDNYAWWSTEICDSSGNFSILPTITFNFTKTHLNPGFTIIWDLACQEYAVDFIIRTWSDGVASDLHITDNDNLTFVSLVPASYEKIDLIINKWSVPYRRARISEVLFGLITVYDNNLIELAVNESIDLLNSQIFSNTLDFSINNLNKQYDIINPSGIYAYLQEQQEVQAYIGIYNSTSQLHEWCKMGKFYLTSWDAPSNNIEAKFKAESILYRCYGDYNKSIYCSATVYDLIQGILIYCGLTEENYYISDELKDTTIHTYITTKAAKEALAMLCIAARAVMYEDRNGLLRFERLSTDDTEYALSFNNAYNKPSITLDAPKTGVKVNYYTWALEDNSTLLEQSINLSSDTVLELSYEASANQSISVTGATVSIIIYYATCCIVSLTNITGAVNITITGQKLKSNINSIGSGNVEIDVQTITSYNQALQVKTWVETFLTRQNIQSDWRQNPAVQIGDKINIESQYGNIPGYIINNVFKYNGALSGSTKMKGLE